MKLNPDCIRNILIFCETNLTFGYDLSWNPISLNGFCQHLSEYSREELAYSLLLLNEACYIEAHIINRDGGIMDIYVYRLTFSGHEFLDTIKSDTIWRKLQKAMVSIGSISLPVIQDLGSHYTIELLKRL